MFVNATRMFAVASRSTPVVNVVVSRAPIAAAQSLHTSAILRKGPPTHSEEAVKAEKHDHSIEELQSQTATKAKSEFDSGAQPTMSEEAAKADVHEHDPLPDHKKKKNSKAE